MKIIVGLGNPGAKYTATKHNIGFITMDEMAFQHKLQFNKSKFDAVYAEAFIGTEKVLLVKPQTFMNDSGQAVRPLMDYYDLGIEDLVVVYSAGGHNGIKSLIQHLGTSDFNRIRIGIDRPFPGQTVINHVLGTFPKEHHEDILFAVKDAAEALNYWIEGHTFLETMNQFNRKS